jgi:hypothetical protein
MTVPTFLFQIQPWKITSMIFDMVINNLLNVHEICPIILLGELVGVFFTVSQMDTSLKM